MKKPVVFSLAVCCSLALVRCSLENLDYLRDPRCAPDCGPSVPDGLDGAPQDGTAGFEASTDVASLEASADTGQIGDAPAPDALAPDAPPDGPAYQDPGIACGIDPCAPDVQFCCVGIPCGHPPSCEADASACDPSGGCGALRWCDDTLDCAGHPGTVCCGQDVNGNRFLTSRCVKLTECETQSSHFVLCDPDAPQPCPGDAGCVPPYDGGPVADTWVCLGL